MTPRQAYALVNPLNRAEDALHPGYYRDRPHKHKRGLMVRTMLAVDR